MRLKRRANRPTDPPPPPPERPASFRYDRVGDVLGLKITGMTNHEIIELVIGVWARLDAPDRAYVVDALTIYNTEDTSWLSPVAFAIADAASGSSMTIDLTAVPQESVAVIRRRIGLPNDDETA